MTLHATGLLAETRALCLEHLGDAEKVSAALAVRGVEPARRRVLLSYMRNEGRLSRPQGIISPQERWMRNAEAGVKHLLDLKRAGHSPRATELRIAPDGHLSAVSLRTRRLRSDYCFGGSPAAACADCGE